jgi:hypothetical protein
VAAPTLPLSIGPVRAAWQAFLPQSAQMGGTNVAPRPRSYNTAAGTIGTTWVSFKGKPIFCSYNHRTTPSDAAIPNAEPPDNTTAWTFSTRFTGARRSVSRVPGAAPRTSTPATAPSGHSTAVTPLAAETSVYCPTKMPSTSVNALFLPVAEILTHSFHSMNVKYCLQYGKLVSHISVTAKQDHHVPNSLYHATAILHKFEIITSPKLYINIYLYLLLFELSLKKIPTNRFFVEFSFIKYYNLYH